MKAAAGGAVRMVGGPGHGKLVPTDRPHARYPVTDLRFSQYDLITYSRITLAVPFPLWVDAQSRWEPFSSFIEPENEFCLGYTVIDMFTVDGEYDGEVKRAMESLNSVSRSVMHGSWPGSIFWEEYATPGVRELMAGLAEQLIAYIEGRSRT